MNNLSKDFSLLGVLLLITLGYLNAQNPILSNPSTCNLGLTITDNNCPESGISFLPNVFTVDVGSAPGTNLGTDVFLQEVRLLIEHPWTGDLDVVLVSPGGQRVTLTSDNGGGDDNYGDPTAPGCAAYTVFSSDSCIPIEEGNAPFLSGPYLPEESLFLFNDGITNPVGNWQLEICDDVSLDVGTLEYVELVFAPLSCLPITDVELVGLDSTTVILNWEPSVDCGTSIIEYGPPGFTPGVDSLAGGGVVIYAECPPFTLTNLQEETNYDIYIRRYCENGNFSGNNCPLPVQTSCLPPAISALEDFDDEILCTPACGNTCDLSGGWRNTTQGDDFDWIIHTGSTNTQGTGPSDDISGGGNYLYLEVSGGTCINQAEAILLSSCFQLNKQGTDTCHLSFNYHMFGDNIGTLQLDASIDGGFNWTTLWDRAGNQGNQWNKAYVGLDIFSDGSPIQFRFVGTGGNGSKGDIAIDAITIYGSQDLGFPNLRFYADSDSDGFGNPEVFVESCAILPPTGFVVNGDDCDDSNELINPGMDEIPCDGIDNNCNDGIENDDIILPPPVTEGDTLCSGNFGSVCATPAYGGFIFWYDSPTNPTPVGIGNCYFPILPPNTGPVPIEYTFYALETNFTCSSSSRTETVIVVNPTPNISTNDAPAICSGQSFDLNSLTIEDENFTGGNITFHSATPASTANELASTIVNPTESTTYYIQMTTSEGCTDEASVTLIANSGLDISFSPSDSFSLCQESTIPVAASITSGNGGYSYAWSTGATSATIDVAAGLSIGTRDVYALTVTDSEGCFAIDSVEVSTTGSINAVQRIVENVTTCNGDDGSISLTPLDGLPPFNFQWSGTGGIMGDSSGVDGNLIIENLPQGEYNVTITDSAPQQCAIILRTILVNGPGAIVNSTSVKDLTCFQEADGEICIDVIGNNPQIFWSTGANTPCIDSLAAGSYSVTITDGDCVNILSDIEVVEPDSIRIQSDLTSPACSFTADGAINLSIFGGTPGYSYTWNTGANSSSLANLPVNTYQVTVTDINDCQQSAEIPLIGPAPLQITLDSLKDMSCNGIKDGYLQIEAEGGSLPYQYNWNTGGIAPAIGALGEGNYTITVTDFKGCEESATFAIGEPDPLEVTILSAEDPDCLGDETGVVSVLASGGTAPFLYNWNTGETSGLISGLGVGVYTVQVSDQNNCEADSVSINLTASSPLDLNAIVTTPSCEGALDGGIDLSPIGIGPFTYNWEDGNTDALRFGLGIGDYPVTITDASGCLLDTMITIAAPQAFTVDLNIIPPTCAGFNNGVITTNIIQGGVPPFNFAWNTGSTNSDLPNLSPGTYQLTITDVNGCTFVSNLIEIVNPDPLYLGVDGIGSIACNGDSTGFIEVSAIGGIAPYEYTWSGLGVNSSGVFNLGAGSYNLLVVDANNCALDTMFILQEPQELEAGVDLDQGEVCDSPTNKLIAEATGGTAPYSFLWNTGAIDTCLVNVPPGDYELVVFDANQCTDTLSSIKVRERFEQLKLDTFIVKDISCNGANDGEMTAIISGGAPPFEFHFSNNHIEVTNESRVTCVGLPLDFDYRVTITSLANGCSVVSQRDTILEPAPLVFLRDGIDQNNCFGAADGAIYASVEGGTPEYSFEWYEGDNLVGQGEDLENVISGTYIGIVTDANGCTDTIVPTTLELNSSFMQLIDSLTVVDTVACRGESTGGINIELTGGAPPYDYEWSNGSTSAFLQNVPAGLYDVTITDADTCRLISLPIQIPEPASAIMINDTVRNVQCDGNSDGFISLVVTGGTGPYEYTWEYEGTIIDEQSGNLIANLPAGDYVLALQDANECTEIRNYEILNPLPLALGIDIVEPVFPEPVQVNALVSGGTPAYSYLWSTGDTVASIFLEESAVLSVQVEDQNGCLIADSVLIVSDREIQLDPSIQIYPNPTSGLVYIEGIAGTGRLTNVGVEVYNAFGEQVFRKELERVGEETVQMDLSALPTGVYLFSLKEEGQLIGLARIVLTKM